MSFHPCKARINVGQSSQKINTYASRNKICGALSAVPILAEPSVAKTKHCNTSSGVMLLLCLLRCASPPGRAPGRRGSAERPVGGRRAGLFAFASPRHISKRNSAYKQIVDLGGGGVDCVGGCDNMGGGGGALGGVGGAVCRRVFFNTLIF
jgi:hypothetical protein